MDFSTIDWKSIAGTVTPLAPKLGSVLGTAIGGPFGGVIGGLAGNALASVFGTEPTPEAVGKAIAEDPNAAAKIQQLEADHGEEIRAQAEIQIEKLKQQTEQFRIGVQDTDSARQTIARQPVNAPMVIGAAALATVFTVAFFVMLAIFVTHSDAIKENPMLALLMGTLVGCVNQIVNFFFGSTQASRDKDVSYRELAQSVADKPTVTPMTTNGKKK